MTAARLVLVVPADPRQACHTLTCAPDDDLLAVLYGTIGCEFVDAVEVDLHFADAADADAPGGVLTMWVDDDGLITDPIAVNARAGKLLDATGRTRAQDIVRDVVITGGADEDGETLGLTDAERDIVLALLGRADLS